jgi:predicted nuclease of predicted toxin-antitoxin system
VKFFADNQLDYAIVRWLQQHGHQARSVQDAGFPGELADLDVLYQALSQRAVLISNDHDFGASRHPKPLGRMIRMKVPDHQAFHYFVRYFDEVLPMLEHNEYIVIEIKKTGPTPWFGTERRRTDPA